MGNESSASFDQGAWCRQHAPSVDKTDVNATFAYVKRNHPLFGCAKMPPPTLTGRESTEDLSNLADAVTVLCCDAVAEPNQVKCTCNSWNANTNTDANKACAFRSLNTTAVGNMAHVSLNHSVANVRAQFGKLLDTWRAHL